LWKTDIDQRVGEAEAMQKAERESDRPGPVAVKLGFPLWLLNCPGSQNETPLSSA